MAGDPIQRPTFYEGEVLAAADLSQTVAYPRDQMARHERDLHAWGIASGLGLVPPDSNGQIWVDPGVAIDGTGREVVVATRVPLPDANFRFVIQTSVDWYPVFLIGLDQPAPVAQTLTGACADAQPNRMTELYTFEFGRPGEELSLDDQPRPDTAGGPGGNIGDATRWRILIGYVKKDPVDPKPIAVADLGDGYTVGRRYAGVRADDVFARGTALALHTSHGTQGKPVLSLDETDGARLTFGLQGAQPVFTVSAKGDLTITGQFGTGTPKASTAVVQSGVVSDGALLPLPPSITQAMVDQGQVTLHVQLTPRLPQVALGSIPPMVVPLECYVDEDRRVHCAVWTLLPTFGVVPAACDCLIVAVFPPEAR
jgi:hypothetical protein